MYRIDTNPAHPFTFDICASGGYPITEGLTARQFKGEAQRIANERGRTVYAVERFNRCKAITFRPAR